MQLFVGERLLPSSCMTHGERLRASVRGLLGLGVMQKVVAGKLGLSESSFSRWLRDQPDSKGRPVKISVEALDRFEAYLVELTTFVQETQRSEASAGTATGTAGRLQRSGTNGNIPDRDNGEG